MLMIERDAEGVAAAAAERLTTAVERAVAERGHAMVSLTGGQTPRRLYALLADAARPWRTRIAWDRLDLFWGDERHVPPEHAESNYGMAREALLRHVPVPAARIHRMRGEMPDPREAARAYDAELRQAFADAGRRGLTFDLMLLGIGEDAHIASIFPGSILLAGARPDAPAPTPPPVPGGEPATAAVWAEHLHAWRVTLTPSAILDAREILVVVAGESKADAVHAALEEPPDVARRPAQILRPAADRVTWIVDRGAASQVEKGRRGEGEK